MANSRSPFIRFRTYFSLAIIGWTFLIGGLIFASLSSLENNILQTAAVEARASIEKDLLYRRWASEQGGVYVPVTEETQPNPYLNVAERDITTPSGRQLTLINPAYMMRRIYEEQATLGIPAHLTSLNPYNPNNIPDEWEKSALKTFEDGNKEFYSVEVINGQSYLRLMQPLITEENCLKCHFEQGYKVGDIRGGLSVSIPLSRYSEIEKTQRTIILAEYGVLWLVGLIVGLIAASDMKKRITERDGLIDEAQKRKKEYHNILQTSMDGFWLTNNDGYMLDVNEAYCVMSGYSRDELLRMHINDFEEKENKEETAEHIKKVLENGHDRFESVHKRKDGSCFNVEVSVNYIGNELMASFLRDITEQKQARDMLTASEEKYAKTFQHAPILITVSTIEDGRYIDANEMFLSVSGFSREDIIGKTSVEIGWISADDRKKLIDIFTRDGHVKNMELSLRTKNGSEVICSYHAELIEIEGKPCLLSIAEDITERKRAENKLIASEASLKQSQRIAHVGHWALDFRTNIVTMSDEMKNIFGLEADSFTGVNSEIIAETIHPDDRNKVNNANEKALSTHVLESLEYRIIKKNGEIRTIWAVPGEIIKDAYGNAIKLTGTVQDITERKVVETALRESEEKLRIVFNTMEEGMALNELVYDENGEIVDYRVLEINPAFERNSILSREQVINKLATEIYQMPSEYINAFWKEHINSDSIQTDMFISETNRWMHVSTSKPVNRLFVTVFFDITEQKNAAQALRESEERFRTLVTSSDDIIFTLDTQERHTGVYGKWVEKSALASDFFIGRTSIEVMGEEAGQIHHEANLRALAGENVRYEWEAQNTDNKQPSFYQTHLSPIYGDEGNITGVVGIGRDITEIKNFEIKLRQSEERYRLLFEEMMDGFALHEIVCDEHGNPVDYRFITLNAAFEDYTGLRSEDVVGKTVLEVLPDTEKVWIERYGKVALTGEPDHFEEYSAPLHKYYEVRAFSPVNGQFAVVFHDITERKFSEMITLARIKFVEIATTNSLDTLIQSVLDEAEAMTGSRIGFYHFMEEDQINLTLQNWSTRTLEEFCHAQGKGAHYPIDQAGVWVECVKTKKPVIHNDYNSLLHRKGLPQGHAEVIRELVVPVMRNDKVVAILGVGNKPVNYTQKDVDVVQNLAELVVEIVARKRVEELHRAAQQNYKSLIQSIDGIVWEADAETFQFTFVSEQAERLLGYPVENWLSEKDFWSKQIHPEDQNRAVQYCVEQTKAMKSHEFEYRMIALDGRVVWLRDMVTVVKEDSKPAKLRGIMIDITDKKAANEKIHQLSLAVEQNPASVMITNIDGNIEYVNPKFTEVSGYTADEVIGKNPRIMRSDITPAEEHKKLWSTITTGMVYRGELCNKKKNNELFWEDVMIAPMKNEQGNITHFVAVKEDITERKRTEKEVMEKNADLAALFSISTHLRTAANANDMLPLVLDEMRKAMRSDANAVILLEPDRRHFVYAKGDGLLASNEGLHFSAANSISGLIMKTRQPYFTQDFDKDPNRSPQIKNTVQIGSAVFVPLQSETEFLGVLLCGRHKDSPHGPLTENDTMLLLAIGEMVGNALRRARLYDDALLRMQRVQALRAIDAAITSNMDLNVILKIFFNQTVSIMGVNAADILTFNPYTLTLEFSLGYGFHNKEMENVQLRLGEGLAGRVALERRSLHANINDIQNPERRELMQEEGIRSVFIAPMLAKGRLYGVLELFSTSESTPDEEWMDFLNALATQAAIAINNVQLYTDLQRSNIELAMAYDATIEGWSRALDMKDRETEGHTLRVTEWTVKLAHLAGLSDIEIAHIRRGALLHDIGKMGIPDNILHKAGKLTAKEWDLMRQHPIFAYDMLKPIEFLRPAIDIPYCHHEKWDGTGYPRGLKGTEIPYPARLFAVIDVWDALTTDRPYRKAWPKEKVCEYIKAESGKHFDPEVVNLFLKMEKDLKHKN